MTKAEIVAEIAQRTGLEKVNIQATVESFMEVVKDSLGEGENVYLRGFGSFIIKRRAEKEKIHELIRVLLQIIGGVKWLVNLGCLL